MPTGKKVKGLSRLDLGIYQQQTKKLFMTQELRQYIGILQLSAADLMEFLNEQALENPAIEIEYSLQSRTKASRHKEDVSPLDFVAKREESLQAHLLEHLRFQKISPKLKIIAEYLIGNINSWGYLEITIEEVMQNLNVSKDEAEDALGVVQSFEPAGVGARNLQECLMLQLQKCRQPVHPLVETLIRFHLPDLAAGKVKPVAQQLKVEPVDIQSALEDIRRLFHPKPGAAYEPVRSDYIIPDVIVKKMKDSYVLTLNDDLFPNVVIRQDYQKMLNILDKKNNKLENELYKYLREKVQSGMEMMRSLEQRKKTIYRVAEAVVRRQTGFMEYGTQFVQPLRLKDIAEELDMHESTISRATQGKYMQTPHGVFEFKYFFANGLPAGGGGEVSSVSVKNRIKLLIERENPGSPLSDAKICELLAREGIDISRRTVAKYREELNIPSSAKRKRYC